MIYFKACPRCGGDLRVSQDSYGMYKQCIQCGYVRDVEEQRRPASMDKEVAKKAA